MIEQDEGKGDKELGGIEAYKANIYVIHTRKKRSMNFGSSPRLVFIFQS